MGAITLNGLCPLPPFLASLAELESEEGERETAAVIVAFLLYAGNEFELPIPTVPLHPLPFTANVLSMYLSFVKS